MLWNILLGQIILFGTFVHFIVADDGRPADNKQTHLNFYYDVIGGTMHEAEITSCDPPEGNHPKKDIVCTKLAKVDGNISDLIKFDQECTKESEPVKASIVGVYKGNPVKFEKVFVNKCQLKKSYPEIFEFE